MFRWGWRLFGREWRQQLLVLGLLTAAVAATIWGTSVVTNVQLSDPSYAVFGTAAALVTLPGNDPHLAADIAAVQASWGPTDVIENQNIATGTSQPVQLRAESPHGHYNAPLLGLVSGAYPAGPGQVALTSPRVGFCPAVECASRRDVTVPRSNGTACCRRVSRLAGRSWCDGTG